MTKLAFTCAVLACLLVACLAGCDLPAVYIGEPPQPTPDWAQQAADLLSQLIDKI